MTNPFRLDGKLALITGGKHGNLGPIWCETLHDAGAKTIVFDLPDYDITKPLHIADFRDRTVKTYGPPDIIIHNAAIDTPPTKKGTFFGDVEAIVKVNLIGAVRLTESFLPAMIKNGGGVIVCIGSIQGYRGAVKRNYVGDFEKPVGYNISKAALLQLSRSLVTQYGDKGIRSCVISFGPVESPKLDKEFTGKFLRDVPLNRTVSIQSLKTALLFACCCPEFAKDVLIDAGFTA